MIENRPVAKRLESRWQNYRFQRRRVPERPPAQNGILALESYCLKQRTFVERAMSDDLHRLWNHDVPYLASLECGIVDPEEKIPEFLDALEAAGIDEVIAENQAQLDAWLSAK